MSKQIKYEGKRVEIKTCFHATLKFDNKRAIIGPIVSLDNGDDIYPIIAQERFKQHLDYGTTGTRTYYKSKRYDPVSVWGPSNETYRYMVRFAKANPNPFPWESPRYSVVSVNVDMYMRVVGNELIFLRRLIKDATLIKEDSGFMCVAYFTPTEDEISKNQSTCFTFKQVTLLEEHV
jgi:hypothetical protein